MKHDDCNPEDLLDLMAPLTNITIDKTWKPMVLEHIKVAAKMANIVNAVEIEDTTIELANTFICKADKKNAAI